MFLSSPSTGSLDGSGQSYMCKWLVRLFTSPPLPPSPSPVILIAIPFSLHVMHPTCTPHVMSSMHMLPKSHDSGFYKHATSTQFHIDYTMVDTPVPEDASSE